MSYPQAPVGKPIFTLADLQHKQPRVVPHPAWKKFNKRYPTIASWLADNQLAGRLVSPTPLVRYYTTWSRGGGRKMHCWTIRKHLPDNATPITPGEYRKWLVSHGCIKG